MLPETKGRSLMGNYCLMRAEMRVLFGIRKNVGMVTGKLCNNMNIFRVIELFN